MVGLVVSAVMGLSSPAFAQDAPPTAGAPPTADAPATSPSAPTVTETAPAAPEAAPAEDDTWAELERLPPRASYDLGVGVSWGPVTYWRTKIGPWIGFDLGGTWGVQVGAQRLDRIGVSLAATMEGPFPVYFTGGLEPGVSWDSVRNHMQIGVTAGPSVLMHSHATISGQESTFGASPFVTARIGWSQPWSRVSRRMFLLAEPKIRYIAGQPDVTMAVVIGSGRGY